MGKWANDLMMEAGLAYVKGSITAIVCSSQPATYAAAVGAAALADVPLVSGDYGAFENGAVSGRRLPVPAKSGFTVDTTGTASHVALVSADTLLYVTTITTPQALTAGNTVNLNSWYVEIRDPA